LIPRVSYIGKCFNLQFENVLCSIKNDFIYTISVLLFARPQKPTKGDQASLDLWTSSLVQLWREPTN